MSFNWCGDTTTGAGHVLVVGYLTKEVKRQTLEADTNTPLTFSAKCSKFFLQNFGPADAYFNVDAVATVDGQNSILVPANGSYTLEVQASVIHAISSGVPKVQVVGVR